MSPDEKRPENISFAARLTLHEFLVAEIFASALCNMPPSIAEKTKAELADKLKCYANHRVEPGTPDADTWHLIGATTALFGEAFINKVSIREAHHRAANGPAPKMN